MTLRTLHSRTATILATLKSDEDLEVTVRCFWEDEDGPNGNCFDLKGVSVEQSHADESKHVMLDCDQEDME